MRIAAYCRVSTDKGEQLDSLCNQKLFFAEYAARNGHELVQLYADEGISGTSLKKRDQFLRLLEDARRGLFEMVVVKDASRLARNTVDFLQSVRTLRGLGVNILFLTANMDSLGGSEFVLTLFGALAQEESANLSKRVKFGKRINAEKGRVPQRIFGYDRIDNFTLEINAGEAQVVREIFGMYLQGMGCRTISAELNRLGRRTKLACPWDPKAVRRVLGNSIYCGRYVNHKGEVADYLTGRRAAVPEAERFRHERPGWAIVQPEVFDQAQRQMAERRRKYAPGGPPGRYSGKHLFSTLIRCEECGRAFCRKQYTYAKTRIYWKCSTNDRFSSARCGNTVKLEEGALRLALSRYLLSRIGDRESFVQAVLKDAGKAVPEVREDGRRRRQLLARRSRYQELYANELMDLRELQEKSAAIAAELAALDRQPERAEASAAEVEAFLRLETALNQELRQLIERVSVSREGRVRIVLRQLEETCQLGGAGGGG